MESTISAEILGHNGELYGYLIYRASDHASVTIIAANTAQLNYRYNRNFAQ
jgi:hypothetical protein